MVAIQIKKIMQNMVCVTAVCIQGSGVYSREIINIFYKKTKTNAFSLTIWQEEYKPVR